ncbi:MAG: sirohydrochlorin chelatase, partial [Pseudomonadota bacterium]
DFVIDTFVDRVREAQSGTFDTDHDLMASFKERLARNEVEVHHHHAEFRDPLDDENVDDASHDHNHSHDHDHHHHHHGVYKHIIHPHGPRTMIDEGVCCCFMSQFPDEVVEEERQLRSQVVEEL